MSHNHSAWSLRVPGVSRNLSQEEVNKIAEKGKHVFFFVIGCGVIATEVVIRKSTDVVSDLGNAMADAHTAYVDKVRSTPVLLKSITVVEPRTVPVLDEVEFHRQPNAHRSEGQE